MLKCALRRPAYRTGFLAVSCSLASVITGCATQSDSAPYTVDQYMSDPAVATAEPDPVSAELPPLLNLDIGEPRLDPAASGIAETDLALEGTGTIEPAGETVDADAAEPAAADASSLEMPTEIPTEMPLEPQAL